MILATAIIWDTSIDSFPGRGFTSRGQESGSVFSAVVCNIQAHLRRHFQLFVFLN